jgi:hypothetical protein
VWHCFSRQSSADGNVVTSFNQKNKQRQPHSIRTLLNSKYLKLNRKVPGGLAKCQRIVEEAKTRVLCKGRAGKNKEKQDFSWTLKCSFLVRWRLCWAISRQQFNITSPTRGRIGAKTKCTVLPIVKNLFHNTRCFTDSKKKTISLAQQTCCAPN